MDTPQRGRPTRPRASAKAIIVLLMGAAAVLFWLLAQDLYFLRPRAVQTVEFGPQSLEYQGALSLSGVIFDHERLTLTATVSGRLRRSASRGVVPAEGKHWIGLGADLARLECTSWWGEEESPTGLQDVMQFTCSSVNLPAEIVTDELFYPFDEYRVALRPRFCIDLNAVDGCTPEARNVGLTRVELRVSDRTLQITPEVDGTGDPNGLVVGVQRKRFLRAVTVAFGGFACMFLWVLGSLAKPEELVKGALGYFGTFWGLKSLVVPSTVRVFPTVVDYAVFLLFSILFILLLTRWLLIDKEAAHV